MDEFTTKKRHALTQPKCAQYMASMCILDPTDIVAPHLDDNNHVQLFDGCSAGQVLRRILKT